MKTTKTTALVATTFVLLGGAIYLTAHHLGMGETTRESSQKTPAETSRDRTKSPTGQNEEKLAKNRTEDQGISRELIAARDELLKIHVLLERALNSGIDFNSDEYDELSERKILAFINFSRLYRQLAEIDPGKATKFVATSIDGHLVTPDLEALAEDWAKKEPDEALSWILLQDDLTGRDYLLKGILPTWHQKFPDQDPFKHWESWIEIGGQSFSEALSNYSLNHGTHTESVGRIFEKLSKNFVTTEQNIMSNTVKGNKLKDLRSEINFLEYQSDQLRKQGKSDAAYELIERTKSLLEEEKQLTGHEFIDLFDQSGSSTIDKIVIGKILPDFFEHWSDEAGASEAYQWVDTIEDPTLRDLAFKALSEGLEANDQSELAFQMAENVKDDALRDLALKSLFKNRMKTTDGSNVEMVLSIPEKLTSQTRFSDLTDWYLTSMMHAESMTVFDAFVKKAHAAGKLSLDDPKFYDSSVESIVKSDVFLHVKEVLSKEK